MNSAEHKAVAPGEFVTTRWSLILTAAGLEPPKKRIVTVTASNSKSAPVAAVLIRSV